MSIIESLIYLLHKFAAQTLTKLQALWLSLNKILYSLIQKIAYYFKLLALYSVKVIISPIYGVLYWIVSLIITGITHGLWHTYACIIFPIFTGILWCLRKGYQFLVLLNDIANKILWQPLLITLKKLSDRLANLCVILFTTLKYYVLVPLKNTLLWLNRQLLIGLYKLAYTLHTVILSPLYHAIIRLWQHTLQKLYQITDLINIWVITPTVQWLMWSLSKLAYGCTSTLIFFMDWVGSPILQFTRWLWEKCFLVFSVTANTLHNIVILPLSLGCRWALNFVAHLLHSWLIKPLTKTIWWVAQASILLAKLINTWAVTPLAKIAIYSWGKIIYSVSAGWLLIHAWVISPFITCLHALTKMVTLANFSYTVQIILAITLHPAIGLYMAFSNPSILPKFLGISILTCILSSPYFLKKIKNPSSVFGWIYFSLSVATLCTLSLHNIKKLHAKNIVQPTATNGVKPLKQASIIQNTSWVKYKPTAVSMFNRMLLVF